MVPTLTGRVLALTSSVLVHAGVVFSLAGHVPDSVVLPAEVPVAVDISVAALEPVVSAMADDTKPVAAPRRLPAATHTHRYPVAKDHDTTPHDPALVHAPLPVEPAALPSFAIAAPAAAQTRPRFAMTATLNQPTASATDASVSGAGVLGDGEPSGEESVDVPARLLVGNTPPYPRETAEAGIEASVRLEIVVDARGHVRSARVLSRVGYGLDEASVRALRAFRFSPASLRGRAVPVRMRWTMEFRLQ